MTGTDTRTTEITERGNSLWGGIIINIASYRLK